MQPDGIVLIILTFIEYINCWRPKQDQSHPETGEKPCIFPTVHRRTAMYECQNSLVSVPSEHFYLTPQQQARGIWWCSLTDNFDHYPEWRVCPETPTTYGGNQPGRECHFPFIHQKRIYYTCVREGGDLRFQQADDPVPVDDGISGYWWCATTSNFDRDRLWTRCRAQHAHQLPCHFPKQTVQLGGFVQDMDHECQPFNGHWVCQTELNQLRECPSAARNRKPDSLTEGGNNPGLPCHFPFQATLPLLNSDLQWVGKAHRRNVTTCLPGFPATNGIESIYPPWIGYWCATTSNFDEDKLWTRCTSPQGLERLSNVRYLSNYKLAELWSQLNWFRWMSSEERRNFNLPSQAYSQDFQRVQAELEQYRSKWELTSNREINEELQWWIWLAPFWWTQYRSNQTRWPMVQMHSQPTISGIESNRNPLSIGFQLPRWVQAWNSAGWYQFGQGLDDRWNELRHVVQTRWNRAWIIAFLSGFFCATGAIVAILLTLLACIDRHHRNQLIHMFCKRTVNKKLTQSAQHQFQGHILYDCGSDYPPGYLYSISNSSERGQRIVTPASRTLAVYNRSKSYPPTPPTDSFDAFHSVKDSTSNYDATQLLIPKPNIIPADENLLYKNQSEFAELNRCSYFCCSTSNPTCPCRKQQVRHMLNLLVALAQKSDIGEELDKSFILRQLASMLSGYHSATQNCVCVASDSFRNNHRNDQCCATGCVQWDAQQRAEPSAPPPSYEQLEH